MAFLCYSSGSQPPSAHHSSIFKDVTPTSWPSAAVDLHSSPAAFSQQDGRKGRKENVNKTSPHGFPSLQLRLEICPLFTQQQYDQLERGVLVVKMEGRRGICKAVVSVAGGSFHTIITLVNCWEDRSICFT